MAKQESNIFKLISIAISKIGTRLFRINTGSGWTGKKVIRLPANHPQWPGAVVILQPRPFRTGTPAGYSDGTGWTPVVVTEEMLGKTIAVFTAIEAKTATGKVSPDQQNFIDRVLDAGGIAGIARSPEDAVAIVERFTGQ